VPSLAYVDASHGTGTADGKPVARFVVLVYGGQLSWSSKVQHLTASSVIEAEYRAMSSCAKGNPVAAANTKRLCCVVQDISNERGQQWGYKSRQAPRYYTKYQASWTPCPVPQRENPERGAGHHPHARK
jgi:hypothetical protein